MLIVAFVEVSNRKESIEFMEELAMAYNSKDVSFSKSIKKFLKTKVKVEIESQWDELASASFLFKLDTVTKNVEFYFEEEIYTLTFQNEIDIKTLEKIIYDTLLKDEFGVKFNEKEMEVNCFVYILS